MTLLPKTILVVGITLTTMIVTFYFFVSQILIVNYAQLEKKEVEKNLQTIVNAIFYEADKVKESILDWAKWDETYFFVKKPSKRYKNDNLTVDALADIPVNVMIFANNKQQIVATAGYITDATTEELLPWKAEEVVQHVLDNKEKILTYQSESDQVNGFISFSDYTLMIASHPVLRNGGVGPAVGMLLFGRLFEQESMTGIAERQQLDVNFYPLEQGRTLFQKAVMALESGNTFVILPTSDKIVEGYTFINDLYDKPILLVRLRYARTTYLQGKELINTFLLGLSGLGLVFLSVVLILLRQTVLIRLFRLVNDVQQVARSTNRQLRVRESGRDELTVLSHEINAMLQILEEEGKELLIEQKRSDSLLYNILPTVIALRIKNGERMIAEHFDSVSILFCDIVGFTYFSSQITPEKLVSLLNEIFSQFDLLTDKYGLEKIKTIGDAYMVVAGVPLHKENHAELIGLMGIEMLQKMVEFNQKHSLEIAVRIGINTGKVIAGIIGQRKFSYDLWGDAVNVASRMESHGVPNKIHCSEYFYYLVKDIFVFDERGEIEVKGKGRVKTYFLMGKQKVK